MAFRATFDCLWCGAHHETRTGDDLEGWAQLCQACVGRAGDNPFLRSRLRAAIAERGQARSAETSPAVERGPLTPARWHARPAPTDEWYLRHGGSSVGAIGDATWAADLDAATLAIDASPLRGRIVELSAGGGWWTPLLAEKGECWAYVRSDEELDVVTARLVAHRLRAHVHMGEPDLGPSSADGVFAAFRLGGLDETALRAALVDLRRALRAAGTAVILEAAGTDDPLEGSDVRGARAPIEEPAAEPAPVPIDPAGLERALASAGFEPASVRTIGRSFVVAVATVSKSREVVTS